MIMKRYLNANILADTAITIKRAIWQGIVGFFYIIIHIFIEKNQIISTK